MPYTFYVIYKRGDVRKNTGDVSIVILVSYLQVSILVLTDNSSFSVKQPMGG